jgi:CRP/FNR family transcriptional regulator, cyclic AMP receptor protein
MEPTKSTAIYNLFKSKGRLLRYGPKQVIMHEADNQNSVFLIKNGYTKFYFINESNCNSCLFILKPGEIFPITNLLGEKRKPLYGETLTNCEFYKLDQQLLQNAINENSNICMQLLALSLYYCNCLIERALISSHLDPYDRFLFLMNTLLNHYSTKEHGLYVLNLPLTQQNYAEIITTTRETICRSLRKMETQGIITKNDRKIYINATKLRQAFRLITDMM